MLHCGAPIRYIIFLTIIATTAHLSVATDHIVGDNRGWNPGINYTLWAGNHTFYVNDLISFRYQRNTYNVFRVNETGYLNCTTEGALGNWSSGKDFILLDKPKRYYFIGGNGFCFSGMKVTVLVHKLPPPPTASAAGEAAQNSGGEAIFRCRSEVFKGVLRAVVVSIGWIWFGFGGI